MTCLSQSEFLKNAIRPLIPSQGIALSFFSLVSTVILHCAINSCFWEGAWLYLRYTHIYISTYISFKILFFRPSCLPRASRLDKISFDHLFLSWLKGLNSPCFWLVSSIILVLSIHAFGKRWMLHITLFFYRPALLYHSILLGKTTLPLFTPLGGDSLYIFLYKQISFNNLFYHPSCLSHSKFLKNAIRPLIPFWRDWLLIYFTSFFCYPSLLYQLMLLGGIGYFKNKRLYFFQESLLSSFMSVPFHRFRTMLLCHSILPGKTILFLFTPLKGNWFYIYIYMHYFQ